MISLTKAMLCNIDIFVGFLRAMLHARYSKELRNIYVDGHKFFRHSRSLIGNRIRWTCSKKHKYKCKASATTIDGVVISTTGLHSHAWVHVWNIKIVFLIIPYSSRGVWLVGIMSTISPLWIGYSECVFLLNVNLRKLVLKENKDAL